MFPKGRLYREVVLGISTHRVDGEDGGAAVGARDEDLFARTYRTKPKEHRRAFFRRIDVPLDDAGTKLTRGGRVVNQAASL